MKPTPSDFVFLPLFRFFVFFCVFDSCCFFFLKLFFSICQKSLANELTHEMTMTEFTPLDVDDMMAAYKHSKNRVILFDYGGSLLEKEVRFGLRDGTYLCVCVKSGLLRWRCVSI